jgi:hypothetical protein
MSLASRLRRLFGSSTVYQVSDLIANAQALLATNGNFWSANSGQNGIIFVGQDFETNINAPLSTPSGIYGVALTGLVRNSY